MKLSFLLNVIALGTLLSGCVAGRNRLVLDTVGPPPESPPKNSNTGSLTVYSAYEASPQLYSRSYDGRAYSDYEIFNSHGKLLERVHNDPGTIIEEPVSVALPPGKYRVVVRANGYGYVTVPVAIEMNKATVLHLEGGGKWSSESGFNATNAVRLPDGCIVGYKGLAP